MWECIANVFRKLYVKYKSNPMKLTEILANKKTLTKKGQTDVRKSQPLCLPSLTWVDNKKENTNEMCGYCCT